MRHEFLSEAWVEQAKRIRDEHRHRAAALPLPPVRVNLVVRGAPFEGGEVKAHTDTTAGDVAIDLGHLENPDVTVTVDYATAKLLLVEQDPQATLEAFILGKIRIDGDLARIAEGADLDLTQLPALLTSLNLGGIASLAEVDPVAAEIAEALRAITA